jgi:hypothetical protein
MVVKKKDKDVVVKRREKKILGIFIDGPALDRAARRMGRKIELSSLLQGVASGITPTVARYYTLIPYEDDSRHRAFLDAVRSAGFRVIVKRLPPKGITRQVTVDVEMAADIVAFGLGHSSFSELSDYHPETVEPRAAPADGEPPEEEKQVIPVKRIATVVCPSRELAYPLSLIRELGVDTASADFGKFNTGDILKSAAKWIDLSDSETIWRD